MNLISRSGSGLCPPVSALSLAEAGGVRSQLGAGGPTLLGHITQGPGIKLKILQMSLIVGPLLHLRA